MSDEDREAMSLVALWVGSDMSDPWMVQAEVIRHDAPEPVEYLMAWAYRRRK